MAVTVLQLFNEAGLRPAGSVRWGERVPENRPGVYMVATSSDPDDASGALFPNAPVSLSAVSTWLDRVPSLTLNGKRPSPEMLAAETSRYWLPDETIVYVGKAGTSLRKRVGQFYSTTLGNRSPHAGGSWIKSLSILDELTIHYAVADPPADMEKLLLHRFGIVCPVHQGTRAMPFGNLQTYAQTSAGYQLIGKPHGVDKWKLP